MKRLCVWKQTLRRLEANALAFEGKRPCVLGCMGFERDWGGCLLDLNGCLGGIFSSWWGLMDCFGLSF